MNKIIEMGKLRGKLRKAEFMSIPERSTVLQFGNKQERKRLAIIEQQEQLRYGGQKEKIMKVLARDINNPVFMGAVHRLEQCSKYTTPQATWNIMKLIKACRDLMKEYRDLYQKMVKEFVEVDADGNIKVDDKQELVYKEPAAENEKAHQAKFEEFMKIEIDVPGVPLSIADTFAAGLSPIELDAIQGLVDTNTVPS